MPGLAWYFLAPIWTKGAPLAGARMYVPIHCDVSTPRRNFIWLPLLLTLGAGNSSAAPELHQFPSCLPWPPGTPCSAHGNALSLSLFISSTFYAHHALKIRLLLSLYLDSVALPAPTRPLLRPSDENPLAERAAALSSIFIYSLGPPPIGRPPSLPESRRHLSVQVHIGLLVQSLDPRQSGRSFHPIHEGMPCLLPS